MVCPWLTVKVISGKEDRGQVYEFMKGKQGVKHVMCLMNFAVCFIDLCRFIK